MSSNVPITNGQGQSSVAAEEIGTIKYQQVKIVGGEVGSTSVLGVNPDRSMKVSVIGTVAITGSVVTVGNGSISGTVGASILGWVPIQPSNTSIITVPQSSSVIAVVTGSVITIPTGNQSVSGTVGSSIIGWVPIQPSNTSVIAVLQSSSIIAVNAGSVVAISQGSVITAVQGSVAAAIVSGSIMGTYAEDAAHTSGEKGLFTLGVRNDTLASITSADGDYSPFGVGPVGENIVANAPLTKWVQGVADLRVVLGSSVTAIGAQGASVFTYITSAQIANFGPSSVLVKIGGGLGSTLGWTIAPAGGGSNIVYQNALKTGENSAVTASINGTASVLVSLQGFIAKI